jgi:hypothetical protein
MYTIDTESIQKLFELAKQLNMLEVRGASNINVMYKSMTLLEEVLSNIKKSSTDIVVDNTKGG